MRFTCTAQISEKMATLRYHLNILLSPKAEIKILLTILYEGHFRHFLLQSTVNVWKRAAWKFFKMSLFEFQGKIIIILVSNDTV